jgi:hypothetical protein
LRIARLDLANVAAKIVDLLEDLRDGFRQFIFRRKSVIFSPLPFRSLPPRCACRRLKLNARR